jgi:hypothetical protein
MAVGQYSFALRPVRNFFSIEVALAHQSLSFPRHVGLPLDWRAQALAALPRSRQAGARQRPLLRY